jgi:hypothetical protein
MEGVSGTAVARLPLGPRDPASCGSTIHEAGEVLYEVETA